MSKVEGTRFINEESQVPQGWLPLKEVTDRSTSEGKTFARQLSYAHQTGEVRAVKLVPGHNYVRVGRVWVHPDDYAKFRRKFEARRQYAEQSQVKAASPQSQDDDLRAELRRVTATLADLQAAVELYVLGDRKSSV